MIEEIIELTERDKMVDYLVEYNLGKMTAEDIKQLLYDMYSPWSEEAIKQIYNLAKGVE